MPHDTTPTGPPARPRPDPPAEGIPGASGSARSQQSPQPPQPPKPADLGLVDGLAQLSFLVHGTLGQVAAEHGLSIAQLRLLGVLRDREPGMRELARHLGLDKSSMTGLVDRAERRDLVRRTASPHDGRAVLVSLTGRGHELARAVTADADRRVQDLAAHLTGAQRSQLSVLASALVGGHSAI